MAQMTMQNKQFSFVNLEPFLGVDYSVSPTQINDNRSPDMRNFVIGTNQDLVKRTGYMKIHPFGLGEGPINAMFHYRRVSGEACLLVAHRTNLYCFPVDKAPINIISGAADLGVNVTNKPEPIYSELQDKEVLFYTVKDKCYIMDGAKFLVFDGETVEEVTPYIPTLSVGNTPTGGGTVIEDWNLIGSGFKEKFSGDGSAKTFQLSQKELDADEVLVKVDMEDKVEDTDFTVDREKGTVTFDTVPPKGTDNVEITAFKASNAKPEQIIKNSMSVMFGGANDTRVFISGNPDMPDYVWRSGLEDPTYWPENGFYKFPDKVMGFHKQYDYLVVERERGKHVIDFQLNGGDVSFPERPVNDQVGTIAKNSLQLLDNNPVSLSKTGVYMLVASNIRTERNVQHISERVDPLLLNEPNLEKAISIDFDRKYWLAVNGNVYIYDYSIGEWYIYDNIHATCFEEIDGYLYFGSSQDGFIYRFMKEDEPTPYHDDGEPIKAYWLSKTMSFNADAYRKLVEQAFISIKPSPKTSVAIYYVTDNQERRLFKEESMNLFSYGLTDYSSFSYATNSFPQNSAQKIKAKKIVYFQLELRNEKLHESLGINSIGLKYYYQSLVR